ncbi:MAG: porin [Bryobacteraceae bacterium]
MLHRRFFQDARAKDRAVRAFHAHVARGRLWWGPAVILTFLSGQVWAQSSDTQPSPQDAPQPAVQTTDQKLEQLERQVDELDRAVKAAQRKQELAEQAAAEKAKMEATVTANTSGFTIRSPRGNYLLKIGADLQLDNRTYLGSGAEAAVDTLVPRRVRPTFSGTIYQYIDFMFRPDFGQGTTAIYDAYAQLNYLPWANLRVGKFKPPVGLERLQSDDDTSFVERGLPSNLGPQRDVGYQLSANLFKQRVSYAVAVFNGVPDASIGTDTAVSDHRDYSARVFLTPFLPDENVLSGLGLGFGGSGGNTDGEALPVFKTFGQQSFFTFASGVTAAGHRTRLDPQGYYYLGPFGLLTEYAFNEEGFQKSGVRREIAFRAYQVQASYILTGEEKSFASPTPRKSFDPMHGGWGAVELAARLGDWEAEKGVYSYGLVNSGTAPRHLHEWTGGANWYLNRLFRIAADYGKTNFGGGAPNSNRLPERTILLRFQINFT